MSNRWLATVSCTVFKFEKVEQLSSQLSSSWFNTLLLLFSLWYKHFASFSEYGNNS